MLLEVLVAPRRALHGSSPCEPKEKPCSGGGAKVYVQTTSSKNGDSIESQPHRGE